MNPIGADPFSGGRTALTRLGWGLFRTLSWRSLFHAWRAWCSGFRQSGIQGDPWQLGSAFVVIPEGKTACAWISRQAGDHPSPPELLAVLEQV